MYKLEKDHAISITGFECKYCMNHSLLCRRCGSFFRQPPTQTTQVLRTFISHGATILAFAYCTSCRASRAFDITRNASSGMATIVLPYMTFHTRSKTPAPTRNHPTAPSKQALQHYLQGRTHRQESLTVIDFHEQFLEQIVSKGVDHHLRQIGQSLLKDSRHGIFLVCRRTLLPGVTVRGAIGALVQFLLQQPAPNLLFPSRRDGNIQQKTAGSQNSAARQSHSTHHGANHVHVNPPTCCHIRPIEMGRQDDPVAI